MAIKIDAYPNASKIAEVSGQRARRLSSLRLHHAVLEECERAMQEWLAIPETNASARSLLVAGVATKYFSCFGRNSASGPLNAAKIFGSDSNAMECFDFWKAVRDNHIAHDVSTLSQPQSLVAIGPNGEFVDVVSLTIRANIASDSETNNVLYQLIWRTMKWVETAIEKAVEGLREEVAAMTDEQRLALKEARYTAPSGPHSHR
ncbi:hypothetical protein JNB88_05860 [Rhizobium cauense]|uniref:hypothetical protein n=1 Tax=Rhizobium cauense TaxID=1166683 RepID=UPI001C6E4CE7|nr:hypothetical protein [Rhizobium cauense]MBW9113173.1 hypothetical protein [Rhizobium cauense]